MPAPTQTFDLDAARDATRTLAERLLAIGIQTRKQPRNGKLLVSAATGAPLGVFTAYEATRYFLYGKPAYRVDRVPAIASLWRKRVGLEVAS